MSIDFNAPKDKRQLGAVLNGPNLLLTTLAIVAPSLLPNNAGKVSQSAPITKSAVYSLDTPRPLTLGMPNPPAAIALPLGLIGPFVQTPYKTQVFAENRPSQLTLGYPAAVGIPLPLGLPQSFVSTPSLRGEVTGFMASSVISAPASSGTPFIPYDFAQLQPKYQVQADVFARPLTLGIAAPPKILQQSESAAITKYQVIAEQPPRSLALGIIGPVPNVLQQSDSAPPPKYQPQVDVYANTLVLGIKNPPNPLQLSDSSPITKYQVVAQNQGSQLTIGYVLPAPPVALPLGLPVDQFQYQVKADVTFTPNPNLLVLGYPAPPPVVNVADTHDGLPKRLKKRRYDDSAQTQVIRESRLKPKKAIKAPESIVEAAKPLFVGVIADPIEDEEALLAVMQQEDEQLIAAIEEAARLLGKFNA